MPADYTAYNHNHRFLSIKDASRELGGISRSTLWRLAKSGELRTVKLGRRTFVTFADLEHFRSTLRAANSNDANRAA